MFRKLLSKISYANNMRSVVVVLGATGAGKSKLAVEIAKKFDGEVISADSMQIYKGLDIVTNKVTPAECACIPHHMIGFLNPLEIYNVVDFRNSALPIIDKLHQQGKLPVIVGGTHYYVESLLWNILIEPVSDTKRKFSEDESELNQRISEKNGDLSGSIEDKSVGDIYNKFDKESGDSSLSENSETSALRSTLNLDYRQKVDNLSNEELLKLLEDVDPDTASSYHPNNRRKILRSLEVWAQTGVRHSEHLRRQSAAVGVDDLGGSLRYNRVAVLWVDCDQKTLDWRLDGRVNDMINQGLLAELSDFHDSCNIPMLQKLQDKSGEISESDLAEHYRKGIFQCIGFKEFHHYLTLSKEKRSADLGQRSYQEAIEKMKLRTRQYSRRQVKWIRNRFLIRDRMRIPVYAVDASDPSLWDQKVSRVAEEVVRCCIEERSPTIEPATGGKSVDSLVKDNKRKHLCETCNRIFIGDLQYKDHMNSAKHKKALKRQRSQITNDTSISET